MKIASPPDERPRRLGSPGSPWLAWRRSIAALLLPLLLTSGLPLSAQSYDGKTVQAIEWQGLGTLSEETIAYYLGLEVGKPYDAKELDANIKKLWERKLIDDLEVDATAVDGGVKLTVKLVERPVIRSIDYQGLKRVSKSDVLDKVSTSRIQVREGDPMSLGELQRVENLIEEMYKEKGYRFAEARYQVEDVGPNEKRVTFTVDEGGRVRIEDIEFVGNKVYSDIRLRLTMRKTKATNLISRISKHDIYNPATLQEDLGKVRNIYRAAGYKNVVIGEPQVEVKVINPKAPAAKQKRRMFVTLPIDEGQRFKFGDVTIDGNEIYSDERLLKVFQRRKDSWLLAKVVDDGIKAINDAYHNSGYIFARAEPELIERDGNIADLVIKITEGEQFKVGRVEFDGNDRTRDKVLRRELRLQEGDVVSIAGVKNSVTKVNQLGYFKLNEEDPVEIDYDAEDKEVNLVFKGKESERTELQFGGGWSEIDKFFGQFSVNTKNFLGRGEQVGVSVQSGTARDIFDLTYFVPWLLDKPQSLGIRLFNQSLDYRLLNDQERFIRDSQGAVITYGRSFGLFQSASVAYTRAKYDDEQSLLNTAGMLVTVRQEIDSSSFRPFYAYDSRDNPFEPVRGTRFNFGVEYAGGVLGGNNDFWRPTLNFSTFLPVANYPVRSLLAFNLEGGLLRQVGNRGLPFNELYRLGGDNSIRGHAFGSIFARGPNGGPLTDANGFTLGGDRYIQANLEYQFLLGGPFRILAFADAGNVYGVDQKFDLSTIRSTAGIELRVLLPVFGAPLRFIYAFNLDEKPEDRFQRFQFSVGTAF